MLTGVQILFPGLTQPMIPAEETGPLRPAPKGAAAPETLGQRTARGWHSGKRRRFNRRRPPTGRNLPQKRQGNLSGLGTEGAQSSGP